MSLPAVPGFHFNLANITYKGKPLPTDSRYSTQLNAAQAELAKITETATFRQFLAGQGCNISQLNFAFDSEGVTFSRKDDATRVSTSLVSEAVRLGHPDEQSKITRHSQEIVRIAKAIFALDATPVAAHVATPASRPIHPQAPIAARSDTGSTPHLVSHEVDHEVCALKVNELMTKLQAITREQDEAIEENNHLRAQLAEAGEQTTQDADQIERLTGLLRASQQKLHVAEAQIMILELTLNDARAELATLRQENVHLRAELDRSRDIIEELRTALSKSEEALDESQAALDVKKRANRAILRKLRSAHSDVISLRTEVEELRQSLEGRIVERNELREAIRILRDAEEEDGGKIEELEGDLTRLLTTIDRLRPALAHSQDALSTANDLVAELEQENLAQHNEIGRLKRSVAGLRERNSELEITNIEASARIQELLNQIADLEAGGSANASEIRRLSTELGNATASIASVTNQLLLKTGQLRTAQRRIDVLEGTVVDLRKNLSDEVSRRSNLERQLAALRIELSETSRRMPDINATEAEINRFHTQIAAIEEKLGIHVARAPTGLLPVQLASLQARVVEIGRAGETQITELERALLGSRATTEALRSELDSSTALLDAANTEVLSLRAVSSAQAQEIAEQRAALAAAAQGLEANKGALATALRKIKDLTAYSSAHSVALDESGAKIVQLRAHLSESVKALERGSSTSQALLATNEHLLESLEAEIEKASRLTSQLAASNAEMEGATSRASELQDLIDTQTSEIVALRKKLLRAEGAMGSLEEQLSDEQSAKRALEQRLVGLTGDLEVATNGIRTLEATAAAESTTNRAALAQFHTQIAAIEATLQIPESLALTGSVRGQLASLQARVAVIKRAGGALISQLQVQLSEQTALAAASSQSLEKLIAAHAATQAALEEAQAQTAALAQMVPSLQSGLASATSEKARLTEAHSDLQVGFAQSVEETSRLNAVVTAGQADIERLTNELRIATTDNIPALEEQLTAARAALAASQSALSLQMVENAARLEENITLSLQISTQTSTIAGLETTILQVRAESAIQSLHIVELEGLNSGQAVRIAALESNLSEVTGELDRAKSEKSRVSEQLTNLRSEYRERGKTIERCNHTIDNQRQFLAALEDLYLKATGKAIPALELQVREAREALVTSEGEVAELKDARGILLATIEELGEELQDKTDHVTRLEQKTVELEARNLLLVGAAATASSDLDNVRETLVTLQAAHAQTEERLKAESDNVARLTREGTASAEQLSKKKDKVLALTTLNTEQVAQIEVLLARVNALEINNARLQALSLETDIHIGTLKAQITATGDENGALRSKLNEAIAARTAAQEAVAAGEQQILTLATSHAEILAASEAKRISLQKELHEAQRDLHDLSAAHRDGVSRLEGRLKHHDELIAGLTSANQRLQETAGTIARLQAELALSGEGEDALKAALEQQTALTAELTGALTVQTERTDAADAEVSRLTDILKRSYIEAMGVTELDGSTLPFNQEAIESTPAVIAEHIGEWVDEGLKWKHRAFIDEEKLRVAVAKEREANEVVTSLADRIRQQEGRIVELNTLLQAMISKTEEERAVLFEEFQSLLSEKSNLEASNLTLLSLAKKQIDDIELLQGQKDCLTHQLQNSRAFATELFDTQAELTEAKRRLESELEKKNLILTAFSTSLGISTPEDAEALEKELSTTKQALSELRSELSVRTTGFEVAKQVLEAALAAKTASVEALALQLSSSQEEVALLNTQNSDLTSQLVATTDALAISTQEVTRLSVQLSAQSADIIDLKAGLQLAKAKAAQSREQYKLGYAELQTQKAQYLELHAQYNAAKADQTGAKEIVDNQKLTLKQLQLDIESTVNTLQRVQAEADKHKVEVARLTDELADTKAALEAANAKNQALTTDLASATREHTQSQENVAALSSSLRAAETRERSLNATLTSTTEALAIAKDSGAVSQDTISKLEAIVLKTKGDLANVSAASEALIADLREAQSELSSQTALLEDLRAKLDAANATIAAQAAEIRSLKDRDVQRLETIGERDATIVELRRRILELESAPQWRDLGIVEAAERVPSASTGDTTTDEILRMTDNVVAGYRAAMAELESTSAVEPFRIPRGDEQNLLINYWLVTNQIRLIHSDTEGSTTFFIPKYIADKIGLRSDRRGEEVKIIIGGRDGRNPVLPRSTATLEKSFYENLYQQYFVKMHEKLTACQDTSFVAYRTPSHKPKEVASLFAFKTHCSTLEALIGEITNPIDKIRALTARNETLKHEIAIAHGTIKMGKRLTEEATAALEANEAEHKMIPNKIAKLHQPAIILVNFLKKQPALCRELVTYRALFGLTPEERPEGLVGTGGTVVEGSPVDLMEATIRAREIRRAISTMISSILEDIAPADAKAPAEPGLASRPVAVLAASGGSRFAVAASRPAAPFFSPVKPNSAAAKPRK